MAAVALLAVEPGIGTKVLTARTDTIRRLYVARIRYFVYYRVRGQYLEVVALWMPVGGRHQCSEHWRRSLELNTQHLI